MFYYLQSVAKCYDGENAKFIRRGLAVPISQNLAEALVREMNQGEHCNFIQTGFSLTNFDDEEIKEMKEEYCRAYDNDEPTDDITNPIRYGIIAEMVVFKSETELHSDNEADIDKQIIGGMTFNIL